MNSWKIILATVVIFGAGVFTGGLLVHHIEHGHRPPQEPGWVPPEILKQNFIQKLDEQLNLTPAQREKIQKIIAEGQQRNHELWRLVAPQMRLVSQDTRQRIRQVLTPDQRIAFEEMIKQNRLSRRPQTTNAPPVSPAVPTNAPAI